MGEVLSPPLNEPGPRRILAFATALLANSLLFALIFAVPRQDIAAPERAPFEVTLLSEPVPSEPVPAEETAEQDNPVDPDTSVEPDTPVEAQTVPVPREVSEAEAPVIAALPADGDLTDEDEDAAASPLGAGFQTFSDSPLALPAGPGSTQMFVRNVFCSSSSDANREAGACPDRADENTFQFARFASEEELARVRAAMGLDLTPAQIRALFNIQPTRNLAGQATMTNQHSQHTSSADSMRDSLPSLVPDPGFGD